MGYIELLLIILAVVLIASVAVYVINNLAPSPVPPYVANIIWVVAVLIILFVVLTAFGLIGRDITIPRLR